MKSLVAEDDFTSRLLMQKILLPYGECHIAVNGEEAIEAFRVAYEGGVPYDLVCLDIMMPEVDGKAALRVIRGIESGGTTAARVIMTTALDDVKTVMEVFKNECDAYMVKPIDRGKLVAHLKSFGLIPAWG